MGGLQALELIWIFRKHKKINQRFCKHTLCRTQKCREVCFYLLKQPDETLANFANDLASLKKGLRYVKNVYHYPINLHARYALTPKEINQHYVWLAHILKCFLWKIQIIPRTLLYNWQEYQTPGWCEKESISIKTFTKRINEDKNIKEVILSLAQI